MAQPSATFVSILRAHLKTSVPNYNYQTFCITNDLRQSFAPKQVLVTEDLPLDEYLAEKDSKDITSEDMRKRWDGGLSMVKWDPLDDEVSTQVQSGHLQVTSEGVIFDVFKFTIQDNYGTRPIYALVFDGETDSVGRDFVRKIASWGDRHDKRRMLVFSTEVWHADPKLSAAIRGLNWEDLVLDREMINRLKRDVRVFFQGRQLYQSMGVPWKRGILLIGPPGNGKSHTIKILAHECRVRCLYVKSTGGRTHSLTREAAIMAIFEKARASSPCLLVLEDLDALLAEVDRAFFLNEVDGFASNNDGILILASSNHPERIDASIINRPSRFDVNYSFQPPSNELRAEVAVKWLAKIAKHDSVAISFRDHNALARRIAEETKGFSYAYMKELFLSFLLSVAQSRSGAGEPNYEPLLFKQIEQLRQQIRMAPGDQEKGGEVGSAQKSFRRAVQLFQKLF